MTKLERFFDKCINISDTIYENYELFDYEEQNIFEVDVNFLATTIYKIKITEEKTTRPEQSSFRKRVLEEYNNKCVITGTDCDVEIDAAHIVPHSRGGSYDVMNGLSLKTDLHRTFDASLWCINPETLCVEIKPDSNVGEIKKYEGKHIELKKNSVLYLNLIKRYKMFKN